MRARVFGQIAFARDEFGLSVSEVKSLPSYDDQNFVIVATAMSAGADADGDDSPRSSRGTRYVFKVSHERDSEGEHVHRLSFAFGIHS